MDPTIVAKDSPDIDVDKLSELILFELTRACERIKTQIQRRIGCDPTYYDFKNATIDTSTFVEELERVFWESENGLGYELINVARVNSNMTPIDPKRETPVTPEPFKC